jgi:hypothetical protein
MMTSVLATEMEGRLCEIIHENHRRVWILK